MAEDEAEVRYEDGDELRAATERELGRPLTTAEWDTVDPDGYYRTANTVFDTNDRDDLVTRMRELPARPRPSPEQPQREQALAQRKRIAAELKGFVEERRLRVFGRRDPPFPEDARAAAAWVEEEAARSAETARVQLTLVVPATHPDALGLWWLRDWLAETLGRGMPSTVDEAWPKLLDLLGDPGSPLIHFGPKRRLLSYFGIAPGGEFGIKHVPAPDGSPLGNLLVAIEEVSDMAGWDILAASHHLLTGGLMSVPVRTTLRLHGSRHTSPRAGITLDIEDLDGTTAAEVKRRFTEDRRHATGGRQRGRPAPRNERLITFVEEHPVTWRERYGLWNATYPDDRFVNLEAMARQYRRATGSS